jgi:hypothetical protein
MPSPSAVAAETNKYRKVVIIAKSGRPVAGTCRLLRLRLHRVGLVHLAQSRQRVDTSI